MVVRRRRKMNKKFVWQSFALAIILATPGLSWCQDKVLIVNTRQRAPEMVVEGDKHTGPLLDIIKEVAQKAGYDVKFVERQFDASLKMLQQKDENIDILPRTRCTEERVQLVDFFGPIGDYKVDILFLVKPGQEDSIQTFDDLKKVKVGVKRGSYYFKEFSESKEINKVEADDDDNLVRMFDAGRFDVLIVRDKDNVELALKKHNVTQHAYAKYKQPLQTGNYYAITQGHPLKDTLQKALEELVLSGRVKEIYQSYGLEPPIFDTQRGFVSCQDFLANSKFQ
jgi:polar amino acid transport system substrate-binding protein